jgi:hypothetical protein
MFEFTSPKRVLDDRLPQVPGSPGTHSAGVPLYAAKAARVLPIMRAALAASRPFSTKCAVKITTWWSVGWK